MKIKSLPPYAPTLMESTRAIGYTLESAIADIIDNSVSASASLVDIFFFPTGISYIAILDDGDGMDASVIFHRECKKGGATGVWGRKSPNMSEFGLIAQFVDCMTCCFGWILP